MKLLLSIQCLLQYNINIHLLIFWSLLQKEINICTNNSISLLKRLHYGGVSSFLSLIVYYLFKNRAKECRSFLLMRIIWISLMSVQNILNASLTLETSGESIMCSLKKIIRFKDQLPQTKKEEKNNWSPKVSY